MLVEKYIEGREASVECLIVGSDVRPLVVHDKIGMEEGRRVFYEHLLIAPPERFTPAEVSEMRDYAVHVVRAIGLTNMFCHVELRYDDNEGPLLLEINPRMGAGCVRDSIETFTHINVVEMELSLILGEAQMPRRLARGTTRRHGMAFLFSPRSGVLREFSGLRRVLRLPEVKTVRVSHAAGDRVGGDSEEIFLAGIWMKVADSNAAWKVYEHIRELVHIRVD
jgi:predicted ATP-grasp superfamily ATP-dependent carboligase